MPCDMDEELDDEEGKTWEEGPGVTAILGLGRIILGGSS